ncbi:hypothetical protein PACILC2_30330 [Paenibacillus cisolokensis]|uniref:Uncharacterized protein n=1 Tax=Paenibacillus cisolokensis TaxID=1658519 RepID=A0ABQ4N8E6_9BACL|nr:hypothetical protein PACILC2_30330 [Paenibacillus cisolokensis]
MQPGFPSLDRSRMRIVVFVNAVEQHYSLLHSAGQGRIASPRREAHDGQSMHSVTRESNIVSIVRIT